MSPSPHGSDRRCVGVSAPRRRRQQGFALLIVMIIAATAAVVAVSLTRLAGAAAQAAGGEENRLLAANAARTGLERATAYALQIAGATTGDFDLVLDPLEEADCTMLDPGGSDNPFDFTQLAATNTILRPRFNDPGATMREWPAGSETWWRVVPHGGGAYLVRFEDDGDDDCSFETAATLHPWTSNTPSGADACFEGVRNTGDTPPGYSSAVNPVRDMNRAIWVVSVGIYPGTNPATARYRITERRMVTNFSVAGDPAFIAPEVHGHNGAVMVFESDEGIPRTDRFHMKDGSSWQFCRAESNDWDHDPAGSSAATNCGTLNYTEAAPPSDPITIPALGNWNDASRASSNDQCLFYMRNYLDNGLPAGWEGLWWWNRNATYGGGTACSSVASVPPPPDNSAADVAQPESCWMPIMVSPGPSELFDPCGFGQARMGPAVTDTLIGDGDNWGALTLTEGSVDAYWYPPAAGAGPPASATCIGYFNGTPGVAPTLPNFATTCGNDVLLPGVGPVGGCSTNGGCNGSEWAIHASINPPHTGQWRFRAGGGSTHYVPNGTYVYEGDFITTNNYYSNWNGSLPPPMYTLITRGRFELHADVVMAFGTARSAVGTSIVDSPPGLVLMRSSGGTQLSMDGSAVLEVHGALYSRNRVQVQSGAAITMHGPVVLQDRLHVEGGGHASWLYDEPYFASAAPPASPTIRMAFPLRF